MKLPGILIAVLVSLPLVGCGSKSTDQVITITGSSTIAPLIAEIAKQYETNRQGFRIDVQSGGTSKGLMDVRTGISDIGMVSRKLKDSESDVNFSTIGIDGISLIVNSANPLENISSSDVIAVYKGDVTNWSEIGGAEGNITVVNKAEGRSTLEIFTEYFGLNNREIKASVVIGDNQQGIQAVAGNPDAIGYVSIGAAEYEVLTKNAAIKLLGLDGIEASTATLRNGSYNISRELNLIYKDDLSATAREFVGYVNSKTTVPIFSAHYFIKANDAEPLILSAENL